MPDAVIILAAGMGTRLKPSQRAPKPLVTVAGIPILVRTVRSWREAGATHITVVTGAHRARIEQCLTEHFGDDVHTVHNPDYRLSNGVSVLAGAKTLGAGTFVISMADHLLDRAICTQAVALAPNTTTLFVDRHPNRVFDLDDATKVQTNGDRIVAVGKGLTHYDCIDVGVFACTPDLVHALSNARSETGDVSLSQGVDALARRGAMRAVSIGDALWQDIDDAAMFAHAESLLRANPDRFVS